MSITYTWLPSDLPDIDSSYLKIVKAAGSYLISDDGLNIYDAISSWWCKPLGHQHRLVIDSINDQLKYFEHHIPAKLYNSKIEELSRRLVQIFTQMDKVIYASDGSSAVEIAMKLSYEVRVLNNQPGKYKFIALNGAYHGETIFTLGVCGIDKFKTNYKNLLIDNYFIEYIPYVESRNDPIWENCNFDNVYWDNFFKIISIDTTALIFEPIVQGGNAMKIISKDFLQKIIFVAKKYGLHIIADEIMVGLGRLGCYSVSKEILNIEPDLVCFAKNLTAGSIPMSAVVINHAISDQFRFHNHVFPHSHTHSCNTIAASVAVNYLKWLEDSDVFRQVKKAELILIEQLYKFKLEFKFIEKIKCIGAIAALELNCPNEIINSIHEIGIKEKILLRPINNTLYIMPPLYNIENDLKFVLLMVYKVLVKINNLTII